jgi:hypothetical protein
MTVMDARVDLASDPLLCEVAMPLRGMFHPRGFRPRWSQIQQTFFSRLRKAGECIGRSTPRPRSK